MTLPANWAPRLSSLEQWPRSLDSLVSTAWVIVILHHAVHVCQEMTSSMCCRRYNVNTAPPSLSHLPHLPHLPISAPPLTVENILTAVQAMTWRELGERLIYRVYSSTFRFGGYPKLNEIERQHQSDDGRLRAVIECWLQGDGVDKEPSWRRIIWALDDTNETTAPAETIRHLAEPLPGKSCDSITFLYSVQILPHIR